MIEPIDEPEMDVGRIPGSAAAEGNGNRGFAAVAHIHGTTGHRNRFVIYRNAFVLHRWRPSSVMIPPSIFE
jgi:hypothetical protein